MKNKIYLFLLSVLIITSCEENTFEPESTKEILKLSKTSLAQEKHLERVLDAAGFFQQASPAEPIIQVLKLMLIT